MHAPYGCTATEQCIATLHNLAHLKYDMGKPTKHAVPCRAFLCETTQIHPSPANCSAMPSHPSHAIRNTMPHPSLPPLPPAPPQPTMSGLCGLSRSSQRRISSGSLAVGPVGCSLTPLNVTLTQQPWPSWSGRGWYSAMAVDRPNSSCCCCCWSGVVLVLGVLVLASPSGPSSTMLHKG